MAAVTYGFKDLYCLLEHESLSELEKLARACKGAVSWKKISDQKFIVSKRRGWLLGTASEDYDYTYLIYKIVYYNGFRFTTKRQKKKSVRQDLFNYDGTACVDPNDANQLRWHGWAAVCLMKMATNLKLRSDFVTTIETKKWLKAWKGFVGQEYGRESHQEECHQVQGPCYWMYL